MENPQSWQVGEELAPEDEILQAISIRKLDRLETTSPSQGASN
jgi:hypothetical protein